MIELREQLEQARSTDLACFYMGKVTVAGLRTILSWDNPSFWTRIKRACIVLFF